MTGLRETALTMEAMKTRNISELDVVSVDIDVVEKTYKEGTPEEFKAFIAEIDGEDFRVPKSVIIALKETLEVRPELKEFKVKKSGEGRENTKYTVVAL